MEGFVEWIDLDHHCTLEVETREVLTLCTVERVM